MCSVPGFSSLVPGILSSLSVCAWLPSRQVLCCFLNSQVFPILTWNSEIWKRWRSTGPKSPHFSVLCMVHLSSTPTCPSEEISEGETERGVYFWTYPCWWFPFKVPEHSRLIHRTTLDPLCRAYELGAWRDSGIMSTGIPEDYLGTTSWRIMEGFSPQCCIYCQGEMLG